MTTIMKRNEATKEIEVIIKINDIIAVRSGPFNSFDEAADFAMNQAQQ